jgi:hypothetical protein
MATFDFDYSKSVSKLNDNVDNFFEKIQKSFLDAPDFNYSESVSRLNNDSDKIHKNFQKSLLDEPKNYIKMLNYYYFIFDTDFVKIFLYGPKDNILISSIDYRKNIHNISLNINEILKILSINLNLKIIKSTYNLILHKTINLDKSFNVLKNILLKYINILKKDSRKREISIFNEYLKNVEHIYDLIILDINDLLKRSCDTIKSLYKNENNKILIDNFISKIIKKNITSFDLLYQNNSDFFDIFIDNNEINFQKRKNYIYLTESCKYDHNNHIMKILFNDMFQKEISSFL